MCCTMKASSMQSWLQQAATNPCLANRLYSNTRQQMTPIAQPLCSVKPTLSRSGKISTSETTTQLPWSNWLNTTKTNPFPVQPKENRSKAAKIVTNPFWSTQENLKIPIPERLHKTEHMTLCDKALLLYSTSRLTTVGQIRVAIVCSWGIFSTSKIRGSFTQSECTNCFTTTSSVALTTPSIERLTTSMSIKRWRRSVISSMDIATTTQITTTSRRH